MNKTRILFLLGIWVAVLPYLGFPSSWKRVLFTLTGLGLAVYSYLLHREEREGAVSSGEFENFKENGNYPEKP